MMSKEAANLSCEHRTQPPSAVDESDGLCEVNLVDQETVEFDIRFPNSAGAKFAGRGKPDTLQSAGEMADGDLGTSQPFNHTNMSSYRSTNNGHHEETEETYTIEDAIEQMGYGRFQMRVSCIAGLAWTSDAVEMMVLSILSPALQCEWGLKSWELGLITSVVFVGLMLGSTTWGFICDKYGRKFVLVLSSIVTMYFGLMSALALSLPWLLIFRCMVGFGVGGGSQAVTLYSEFLPRKARAKSIVGMEIFFAFGSLFSTFIAYLVMPYMGWRWLLVFSAIPLLLFAIACRWLPESMRFNLSRGHVAAAEKTLKACARENKKPMPLGRLVAPPKNSKRGRIIDLFTKELRVTSVILWFIWFANTFSYYGIVLLTTELLEIQGNDVCEAISEGNIPEPTCRLDCRPLTANNYLELLWTTAAEFPGLLLTFFIIDKLGRKWSSASLFTGFAIATGLVAVCKGRYFMIVFLFAARCFIAGAFQVAFVYVTEIYPTSCRAVGLGTCSSVARIGAVITPFIAQVLIQKSIYATIGIYATIAALAGIGSLMLPIETKGRQLD